MASRCKSGIKKSLVAFVGPRSLWLPTLAGRWAGNFQHQHEPPAILSGGNSIFFWEFFTPKIGEDAPNLTSIFFKWGWNHQMILAERSYQSRLPLKHSDNPSHWNRNPETTGVFSVNWGPWQASIRTSEPAEPEGEDFFVQLVLWVLLIIWLLYLPLRSCIQSWFG